ncbi:hypothetical protein ACWD26_42525 [Streptomyces sp. NPDC002787]
MRAIRVASAALLGVTAFSLNAPAAHAARADEITTFGFSVSLATVAAGGQVALRVDGCYHRATVSSGVFDTVSIPQGRSSATATVDRDAKPGAVYEVTFQCGDESGRTDLTIATGHPTNPPARGSHAGAGGTVAGFDLRELGLGAVLVAGSLGAAWHWSRRRTEEDGGAS